MKKVCVIGNSHVVALKRAYSKIGPAKLGVELVFFAASKRGIMDLEVAGKTLVPAEDSDKLTKDILASSGGLAVIDPAQYDMFLIVGLSSNIYQMVNAFGSQYSRAVSKRAVVEYWHNSPIFKLTQRLASITDKPIYSGHNPLFAKEKTQDQPPNTYVDLIQFSNQEVFGNIPAVLLEQPLNTIVNGENTNLELARGYNKSLSGNAANMDMKHMGEAYGEIWLNSFAKHVA